MNYEFIFFQSAIVVPFLAGFVLLRFWPDLPRISSKFVLLNLTLFEPPLVLWSIWGLSLRREMMVLPVAGLLMVLVGFALGKVCESWLVSKRTYRRAFVISASLANHGFTMGGVLCYLIAGEKGLGLSAIFILYFIPFTFLFIFFYASSGTDESPFTVQKILKFLFNIRNMPLFAVITAICLNLSNAPRPQWAFPLKPLLMVSIGLYYFTLGTNFTLSDLNPFKKEHGFLAIIKFFIIPALTIGALSFVTLGQDLRQVILIEAFMPAAIYSVVTSVLFNLDTRLASGLFIVNSLLFLFVVLPVVYLMGGYGV